MLDSYIHHITPSYNQRANLYNKNNTQSCKNATISFCATCSSKYSRPYRYLDQLKMVEEMMKKQNDKTKMLCIGVGQGQEPLTYIQTASNVSRSRKINIEDVLDMTLVDAACETPIPRQQIKEYGISNASIEYLQELYKNKSKTYFSTPFEEIVTCLKEKKEKYNVILFNNVLQHLNYGVNFERQGYILKKIGYLADLVEENGIFCISCDVMSYYSHLESLYDKILDILKKKGFVQVGKNIFKK